MKMDFTGFRADDAVLVMVDMQQKLLPAMPDREAVAGRCARLLDGAAALGVKIIVTEQYPQGLGATDPELLRRLPEGTPVIAKTSFSVFGEGAFRAELAKRSCRDFILCGIESDICVLQSVFAALAAGYRVTVAADAVASRREADRELALAAARQAGALVTGVDSILFQLLGDAKHPAFKTISRLVR